MKHSSIIPGFTQKKEQVAMGLIETIRWSEDPWIWKSASPGEVLIYQ
jgi:hypothetical protein